MAFIQRTMDSLLGPSRLVHPSMFLHILCFYLIAFILIGIKYNWLLCGSGSPWVLEWMVRALLGGCLHDLVGRRWGLTGQLGHLFSRGFGGLVGRVWKGGVQVY